jgi:hypothetical protein
VLRSSAVRRARAGFVLIVLMGLTAVGACGGEEYALLVQAWTEGVALPAGTELTVHVRDLQGGRTSVHADTLEREVPEGSPLRVAVDLGSAAQLMVHLEAETGAEHLAASRCFTVLAVMRVDVLLLDVRAGDEDGDGWPAEDVCRERGSEEIWCHNQCPEDLADDCNDLEAGFNPGAMDTCADEDDQDCFGGDAECVDADGDGFTGCPAGVQTDDCDCDDSDRKIHPAVPETARVEDDLCENGLDDDCDGEDARCDRDHDGVPACAEATLSDCDCDDADERRYPNATETPGGVCDHVDNNCNGAVDEVRACLSDDLDGDGAPHDCAGQDGPCSEDCNDCNAAMTPGREGVCGNRIDEACELGGQDDGALLPDGVDGCPPGDADRDGYPGTGAGGTDCDDADPSSHPEAPDRCGGGSQDCSGADTSCESDRDGDGWNSDNDCNDSDGEVNPDQVEQCNELDDDCDGVVNEVAQPAVGCISLPAEGAGVAWQLVELATDLLNCGRCRNDCNPDCDGTLCRADACRAGTCACGGGAACAGTADDTCCSGGCRDTLGDVDHCGGCGLFCGAPVCQRPVCRGGVCGTEPVADGERCGEGHVCCGGECVGDCAPGENDGRACGDCGLEERSCRDDCRWGAWGGCQGQGSCRPFDSDSSGCGDCGQQVRTCGLGCSWGQYGACTGQGACAAGSVEDRACGTCGTQSRTCSGGCAWGGWSACGGEGPCAAGDTEQQPCGNCGARARTCSAQCAWGGWGGCTGEGACAQGEIVQEACGDCGTRSRTCGADCEYGAWGVCGGEGECAAGGTEDRPCGNCGAQTRTCGNGCSWGGWAACADGVCAQGDTQPCGACGTRTCAADCTWGACSGQGACTAGDTETRQCPSNGPQQSRTCQPDCSWGAWAPACP